MSVLWKPNFKLRALLTLNGWHDSGYTQMGQLFGIAELSPLAPLSPNIANYPSRRRTIRRPVGTSASTFRRSTRSPARARVDLRHHSQSWSQRHAQRPLKSMGPGSVVNRAVNPPIDGAAQEQVVFQLVVADRLGPPRDHTFTSVTSFQRFTRDAESTVPAWRCRTTRPAAWQDHRRLPGISPLR